MSPGSAGCAVGEGQGAGGAEHRVPLHFPPTLVTPTQAFFTRSTELGRVGRDEVLHWELWCPRVVASHSLCKGVSGSEGWDAWGREAAC